jgi:hypothetical protein
MKVAVALPVTLSPFLALCHTTCRTIAAGRGEAAGGCGAAALQRGEGHRVPRRAICAPGRRLYTASVHSEASRECACLKAGSREALTARD